MNSNYNSQWRLYAKTFGYLQLVVAVIIILVVLGLWYVIPVPQVIKDFAGSNGRNEWSLYLVRAIFVIIYGTRIWASIQLIKAAELGREIRDAYKRCRTWRNITIALDIVTALFEVLFIYQGGVYNTSTTCTMSAMQMFRLFYYFTVGCFLRDLRAAIKVTPLEMVPQI